MKIYLDDIKDFESPQKAADFYKLAMEKAAGEGLIEEDINLRFLPIFEDVIQNFFNAQSRDFVVVPIPADFRPQVAVIIGDIEGRICLVPCGNGHLVILDRNVVLSTIMILYYMGSNSDGSRLLAAYMSLHFMTCTGEAFPFIEQFVLMEIDNHSHTISRLSYIVGQILIFHELGHIYCHKYGNLNILDIRVFELCKVEECNLSYIQNVRFYDQGSVLTIYDNPITKEFFLLLPENYTHFLNEFGPDVFALYCRLMSVPKKLSANHLDVITVGLIIWNFINYLHFWKESYRLYNQERKFDYPPFQLRIDILYFHLEAIARKVDNTWQSPAVTVFQDHYNNLWKKGSDSIVGDALEYCFYTVDADGPGRNEGKIFSFEKGQHVRYKPGLFEKLKKKLSILFEGNLTMQGKTSSAFFNEYIRELEKFSNENRLNDRPIIYEFSNILQLLNLQFE